MRKTQNPVLYHKKFENIKQTVKHFEDILINSQKNPAKSYKSFASYLNRSLSLNKKEAGQNDLVVFGLQNIVVPYTVIKTNLVLIKNIHKYNKDKIFTEMLSAKMKGSLYNKVMDSPEDAVRLYFKYAMLYLYKDIYRNNFTMKQREKESNYILYHYLKYTYNNFGRTACMEMLENKNYYNLYNLAVLPPLTFDFDFSIPEDEPKQEILWLIDCVKRLDKETKEQFVSKLPLSLLNFLLTHKRPGMINITKKARKELTKSIKLPNVVSPKLLP